MNKNSYIKKISEHLCCDIEYAIKIVNILDDNFFISKRSKDKIIKELISSLNIEEKSVILIYEEAIIIIKEELNNIYFTNKKRILNIDYKKCVKIKLRDVDVWKEK